VLPQTTDAPDLAIVIVSTNEGHWLQNCLSSVYAHAGGATLDVVVVDNDSVDSTRDVVETEFPQARVVAAANRGFAHGNNRGLETTEARYVLFLNPDTQIVEGMFGDLIADVDRGPDIGLVGVRQLTPDQELYPTIRRFPSAARAMGDALRSERWPIRPAWAGERVLHDEAYGREFECDWTSGSFMLARREALQSAGFLDERFFIYSEEPDLCLRIKRAGWRVFHLPSMTIVHHACKGGIRPKMIAQDLYARRQYAHKHLSAPHRAAYLGALATRHLIRALPGGTDATTVKARRAAARLALRTLAGRSGPPFGPPPATAVTITPTSGPAAVATPEESARLLA
jgi:N-acetylglucosaminyl-diphospho-decaprenol L-rhamnosyltransferase